MNDGWIKMYFKLREWEWYGDPYMVALWVHLLIEAAWKPRQWKGITIQRGQLVTSRAALAESTGLSEQQLRTCIGRLKINQQIVTQSTSKHTIITICNYDSYQATEDDEQPAINQPTPNEQPAINQRPEKSTPHTPLKKEAVEVQTITPPTPPIGFEKYGKFLNVFLKPVELRKLNEDYGEGEVAAAIEDFSCQLADGTAKPSANHYATLTYWLSYRRQNQPPEVKAAQPGREVIGTKFVDRD